MQDFKSSYDLIVVGAGTGGTIAARFAALQGLKVCLLDTKTRSSIGDKICGDAVGTDVFHFLGINPPQNEELSCHIKGAKLYSADGKKCLDLMDPKQAGYIVHRLQFGQRLLNEAIDAGDVEFFDNIHVTELIYKDQTISGIRAKVHGGRTVDLRSKLIIDASGFYSPLRKRIKGDIIEKEIAKEDCILCYREIIRFTSKDEPIKDPEYITIILDQEKAPGGYIWYFPKDEHSINIGLGVRMDYKGQVKELYKMNVYNEFVKTNMIKTLSTGGGVVPVRRPLWSCASDGILLVGDAACQVNPLHGGGIDPSMRGGFHAANTAVKAIEDDDYSINSLWDYNVKVMTTFGAEFASLDLLRMVLQILNNNDLNFGLTQDLLSGNEILEISSKGTLSLSLFEMAKKAFKGISRPDLLLDLNYLRIRMEEIAKIYKKFPDSPSDFEDWKLKVVRTYDKIKKMLINSKKKINNISE
jgi:digeranylgeranylglycerophospholipid reductase